VRHVNKQAPSAPRIAAMVIFALSCFGLLLFLWLSFGGPIPLKPKGYRVQVSVPEASTLGLEADVRVAGVRVGKVRKKDLDDGHNRTLITMEIDRRFAPVAEDARAILRQKTLLGETYVELTPGTSSRKVPEGGRLGDAQVQPAVELDEIFQALDPDTRQAFRIWQQDLAKGIEGRGRDFNDALGSLPGFAHDAADVLEVLDLQERALSRLVKNTGTVFGALTENEDQLRNLITGSGRLFEATSSRNDALAETIKIFPTFLDESKATMTRLKAFSRNTRPLIQDLRPVARDLEPTVRDVRAFAPDLDRVFRDLDPLIKASKTGLPALQATLEETKPLLGALGPFLSQVNPIFEFLELHQWQVADFISNGAAAVSDVTVAPGGGVGHYLGQVGVTGAESVAVWRDRLSSNRGNTYLAPADLLPQGRPPQYLMFPNWDCKPSGGEVKPSAGPPARPGCVLNPNFTFQGKLQGRFPHVEAADYSK
jgi:phospholipid/cholesterol/gamma-HCH transport system substrate-binding protein